MLVDTVLHLKSSVVVSVSPIGWSRLSIGCVKMNLDAHVGVGGSVGLAVVCRDDEGRVFVAEDRIRSLLLLFWCSSSKLLGIHGYYCGVRCYKRSACYQLLPINVIL